MHVVDSTSQRAQTLQVSSVAILVRIVDKILKDTEGSCSDHIQEFSDAVTMLVMAHGYLSQARKELLCNALAYPLAKFCT